MLFKHGRQSQRRRARGERTRARVVLVRETRTPQGWQFSFRRAKIASPSRPRGRLRQWVCGSPELQEHECEYATSYASPLLVSTLFCTPTLLLVDTCCA